MYGEMKRFLLAWRLQIEMEHDWTKVSGQAHLPLARRSGTAQSGKVADSFYTTTCPAQVNIGGGVFRKAS
jgi:hypothetical protein